MLTNLAIMFSMNSTTTLSNVGIRSLSDLLVDFSPNHDVFLHQAIRDDYIESVENKLLLPTIKKLAAPPMAQTWKHICT